MAFGNPVTDGTYIISGSVGYIVSFDLSGYEFFLMTQIQAQNLSLQETGNPVVEESTEDELYSYINSIEAPGLAYAVDGQEVQIFLKTSIWPYDITTRLAFWFYRNTKSVRLLTDFLDIPENERNLLKQLILKTLSGWTPTPGVGTEPLDGRFLFIRNTEQLLLITLDSSGLPITGISNLTIEFISRRTVSDPVTSILKTNSPGGGIIIVDPLSYQIQVTLNPQDSENLEAGDYYWTVRCYDSNLDVAAETIGDIIWLDSADTWQLENLSIINEPPPAPDL